MKNVISAFLFSANDHEATILKLAEEYAQSKLEVGISTSVTRERNHYLVEWYTSNSLFVHEHQLGKKEFKFKE